MENNRNKSRNILKIRMKKGSFLFYSPILGILLSTCSLILYLILPSLISSNYYQKSLNPLRKQAQAIKNEFNGLISEIKHKQNLIASLPFPAARSKIFNVMKELNLNTDIEGVSYYSSRGDLSLWLGNVIDLELFSPERNPKNLLQRQTSTFLIKDKASVYLISSQEVGEKGFLVCFRLLAFDPQFKTRHLKEYQFLKPNSLRNLQSILYYDFQEDISGFETFFKRHKDEYIGQPVVQDKIQTLFFPLRNENNKIVALVNLSSPSLTSYTSAQKENFLLTFYILFGITLLLFLIYIIKATDFLKEWRPIHFVLIIFTLIGLRLVFLPLSRLEKIKSLPLFSPSLASFLSFAELTKSPADIFLTCFCLLLIILCVVIYFKNILEKKKISLPTALALSLSIISVLFSVFIVFILQKILKLFIFNSNANLLHFTFSPAFLVLNLSIVFLFLSFFLLVFIGLRIASLYSPHIFISLSVLLLGYGGFSFLFREKFSLLLYFLQIILISLILVIAGVPSIRKRKEAFVSVFLLSTLFLYASLDYYSLKRSRSIIQNSLKNIVLSQENWGNFLLNQSFPEIDEERESILSFFDNPQPYDFSQSLWRKTSIAKFNWYSSLEIWNPDGKILSRFSLNVPELPPDFTLPLHQEWSISNQNISFLGKEKNFLVGYKDWFEKDIYLGRTILTLSADYDILPFLYSANPYFEAIRMTSLPSLNQFDFGFAVFDLKGILLFNPNKISSGIPPNLLERIISSRDSLWSSFRDKNKKYNSLNFTANNRVYSFFLPQKNVINYSVEFLKLLFFYVAISTFSFFLINIFFKKQIIKNPLWSFSNKVYVSFIAVAIIPLLLFTFFTRSFFERIFSQQFIERAEAHAKFAYRVMEDLVFLQELEKYSPTTPPEDLVIWISSTISNDVSLYQDGRLISSSRREFYDSGLLPELLDGEIFYKIQFENNPFYTRTQKIGDYSFHTLTIPFPYLDSYLFISLPFPFEQQEISKATGDFIEFLVFISVFFVSIVIIFARGLGAMIINPIKKLLGGTREVSLGNLEVSIEHKPHDEMRTLIDGFNAMIKNLKKHQQELTEMSKKVAWAEMARKVAHEIKNPLTPIQLSAEHLLKVYSEKKEDFDQVLNESASYIIKEVENLRKIAQEFLDLSKETALKKEDFDLKAVIQETVSPFKKTLTKRIKFREIYEGEDFSFKGNKEKIRIALRNIFINAMEAIRNKGEIEVRLRRENNILGIEIKDTGMGMEKEMLEKVFEPYFSTKDLGTGLGLSISKKIIEDHGASIQISSEFRKGTKIMIKLPLSK